jgi:hypothetical protein
MGGADPPPPTATVPDGHVAVTVHCEALTTVWVTCTTVTCGLVVASGIADEARAE